jgi:hypothetical protein
MRGMKLQFSLATLLVCMTALAVVCALSISIPVNENPPSRLYRDGKGSIREESVNRTIPVPTDWKEIEQRLTRNPNGRDVAWRMAVWGPLAIAATLGVLWTVRRLKPRRHTEPTVG